MLLFSAGTEADSSTEDGHHESQTRHAHIFSFGDTLTDTGNMPRILGERTMISRLPYGETFFGR